MSGTLRRTHNGCAEVKGENGRPVKHGAGVQMLDRAEDVPALVGTGLMVYRIHTKKL